MTNLVSPCTVVTSTQVMSLPPCSNNEPLNVPGKNNVVIAIYSRSYPAVINSAGTVKHFAPNAAYPMTGSEVYLNSGRKGQEQGFPGSSNMLALTFRKAGTYNYFCEKHLWMHGSVIAK